ncbi:MAG: LPS export ABC transporter periplasmic protein LptC [candidate division KSB1 bacterium]|nr:LPS export ABC transporter periplasmic protein LptC [candidate division KSB1 bacterium]
MGGRWHAVLFAAALLAGCSRTPSATVDQAELDRLPDQEGWDSIVEVTENGQPRAVIRYVHMLHWPKDRVYTCSGGVEADFYDRQGRHASRARADSALLMEDGNTVQAFGNVVVVSDSGVTLRTEHLRWSPAEAKVRSEVEVEITTAAGDTLRGVGFESDADLSHWRILSPRGVSKKRVDWEALERSERRADSGR